MATFRNGTTESLFLEGCSAFHFEQSVEGEWLERGPSVVCVWEGHAREVAPGVSTDDPFQAPRTTGVWRLRYAVGYGCQSGLPLGQAGCERMATTTTLPFTVERALCDPSEQGCQIWPAAPNHLCPDGVNMGGPNAECTRDPATGQCGYEFLVCP